jgi:cytoskeletal protein CcmA (bactofilin family)
MWKRDELRSTTTPATNTVDTSVQPTAAFQPAPAPPPTPAPQPAAAPQPSSLPAPAAAGTSHIGRSVVVKGELTGSQDLTVDGRVEGFIDLREHELTIGPNAAIQAEIISKIVTVFGSVVGNVTAETLQLRHGGSLEGNVVCKSMIIQDRAHFCGTVDMGKRAGRSESADENQQSRPAAVA